jgi:ATP/ADP translocase
MAGAALMLAHQVAGKAVRDSFFLSNYPASDLPKVVMTAAVISVIFVLIFARLMSRFGPSLMVPAGFLLSSLLHLTEYSFVRDSPARWSLVIYFHIVALSAILLSGFWSLMAESFDPRSAKQAFGRITGAGTLGGIMGGLMAERVASYSSVASVLLLLAAFHLVCSIFLISAPRVSSRHVRRRPDKEISPVKLFRRAPYLGMVALVVLAGTSSAAILDYLFKAGAGSAIDKGAPLLRFFALFYTSTQILTFLAQTFLVRHMLHRHGIGRTISTLPFGLGAGTLGALLVPVFPVFMVIRSLEYVLRGSFYRSAYELLYTPVPAAEKRSAKTLIDVAFDRAGDALGGALVQLFLWIGASFITSELLGVALALAAVGLSISLKLDGAYSGLVQQRLVDRAVELDLADIQDSTTRSVLIRAPAAVSAPPADAAKFSVAQSRVADRTLDAVRELRSGDSRRILAALKGITRPNPVVAAQLVRLLAWDEVSEAVREVLQRHPSPFTGLLVDYLTNQEEVQFGIRRRIPRILARCDSQLAVHGLLAGLADNRFEVRFQCSRALDSLVLRRPDLKVPADAVFAAVERELQVAHPIWNSRRLIDKRKGADPNVFLDEILRERADQSLEHVFSLFATVLPREPVKIAFRVLHTDDKALRGLAAEYLDSILPANLRERLWAMVEPDLAKKGQARESGQQALDKLLQSHESLVIMIDKTPTK